MRTDDGTAYCLPALVSYNNNYKQAKNDDYEHVVETIIIDDDNVNEEEKKCDGGDDNSNETSSSSSSITLELKGLPLIHVDTGIHTGVGARSWYGSAVLSAMLLLGCEEIHSDLLSLSSTSMERKQKGINVIELGSGAIGLAGMTMAWILAQKQQQQQQQQQQIIEEGGCQSNQNNNHHHLLATDDDNQERSKIFLTDCDLEVLNQLEYNAKSVMKTLQEHFYVEGRNEEEDVEGDESKTDDTDNTNDDIMTSSLLLPEIHTKVLDWDGHDEPQDILINNNIDLVVGAELAYTHNNCLALQISKILKLNPKCVIWIVQKPRSGWFQVLQQELKKQNPNIVIQKFDPNLKMMGLNNDCCVYSNGQVHKMAQSIMPTPELFVDINDLRALRITIDNDNNNNNNDKDNESKNQPSQEEKEQPGTTTNNKEEGGGESSSTSTTIKKQPTYDFMEHIEEAHKLSQQINDQQELALTNSSQSHHDHD